MAQSSRACWGWGSRDGTTVVLRLCHGLSAFCVHWQILAVCFLLNILKLAIWGISYDFLPTFRQFSFLMRYQLSTDIIVFPTLEPLVKPICVKTVVPEIRSLGEANQDLKCQRRKENSQEPIHITSREGNWTSLGRDLSTCITVPHWVVTGDSWNEWIDRDYLITGLQPPFANPPVQRALERERSVYNSLGYKPCPGLMRGYFQSLCYPIWIFMGLAAEILMCLMTECFPRLHWEC